MRYTPFLPVKGQGGGAYATKDGALQILRWKGEWHLQRVTPDGWGLDTIGVFPTLGAAVTHYRLVVNAPDWMKGA